MCDSCEPDYKAEAKLYEEDYREARQQLEATWDYRIRAIAQDWKYRLRHPLTYRKRRAAQLSAFDKLLRKYYAPVIREQLNAENKILSSLMNRTDPKQNYLNIHVKRKP